MLPTQSPPKPCNRSALPEEEKEATQDARNDEYGRGGSEYCARCKKVTLKDLFPPANEVSKSNGLPVMDLGALPKDKIEDINCPLCHLFARVQNPIQTTKYNKHHLRAFTSLQILPLGDYMKFSNAKTDVVLKVVDGDPAEDFPLSRDAYMEGNLILPVSSPGPSQTEPLSLFLRGCGVDPEHVDFGKVSSWLETCQRSHFFMCGRVADARPTMLRGIDCINREVVQLGSDDYVALSYVWGRSAPIDLKNPPQLILDAITATQRLKCRYLWVDQCCIDQGNDEEKHHQIQNMDKIYEGALCTIIAVSAEDLDFPFPGISVPRKTQPSAIIEGQRLVSSLSRLSSLNAHSKWATRGWTYQEALLSRRCVFFTNEQVYFVCRMMDCCESIDRPADLHERQSNWVDGPLTTRMFDQDDVDVRDTNVARTSHHSHDQVKDYTQRQLTYNNDVLMAFRGLLNRSNFHSFWGIHLYDYVHLIDELELAEIGFASGLFWEAKQNDSLARRNGFPSWSWAGWIFPPACFPSWPRLLFDYTKFEDEERHDTTFKVQKVGGTYVSMKEAVQNADGQCLPEISQTIEISGLVAQVYLQSRDRARPGESKFVVCHCHPNSQHPGLIDAPVQATSAWLCESPTAIEARDRTSKSQELLDQPNTVHAVKLHIDDDAENNVSLLLIKWVGTTVERLGSLYLPKSVFEALPQERRVVIRG